MKYQFDIFAYAITQSGSWRPVKYPAAAVDTGTTTSYALVQTSPLEANIVAQAGDGDPLVDKELAETDDCSETDSMNTCSTFFEDEAHTCDEEILASDKDDNVELVSI